MPRIPILLPLVLLLALVRARPVPPLKVILEAAREAEAAAENKAPDWSRPSGWLGWRLPDDRTEPELPKEWHNEGHLVNSPIRGVVTETAARHRLGITARELDFVFETRVLNRPVQVSAKEGRERVERGR